MRSSSIAESAAFFGKLLSLVLIVLVSQPIAAAHADGGAAPQAAGAPKVAAPAAAEAEKSSATPPTAYAYDGSAFVWPKRPEQLPYEFNAIRYYSVEAAIAARYIGSEAAVSSDRVIGVYDYVKFTLRCLDPRCAKYDTIGVGLRMVVDIHVLNAGARFESIPLLAASATFKSVNAEATFSVAGITSPKATSAIPAASFDFGVDGYHRLMSACDTVKALLWDDATTLTPVVLSTYQEPPKVAANYADAAPTALALREIQDGRTCGEAIDRLRDNVRHDAHVIGVIKRTYADIAGIRENQPDAVPSADARRRAAALGAQMIERKEWHLL